jgi:hypothetical protein
LQLPEETSITELTIASDGRIFVFGMSRQILELLKDLDFNAADLDLRIEHLHNLGESDRQSSTAGQESHEDRTARNNVVISSKEPE